MSDSILQVINRAVDSWTLKAGVFCSARDQQLDLSEALPNLVTTPVPTVSITTKRIAVPA